MWSCGGNGLFSISYSLIKCLDILKQFLLIYFQRDVRLHIIYFWKTALHVSGGTSTHHQEHTQLYLQYLVLVKPLLLPAAVAAGSSNGLTSTRYCKYSCVCS